MATRGKARVQRFLSDWDDGLLISIQRIVWGGYARRRL
jgi:hypothetical protein